MFDVDNDFIGLESNRMNYARFYTLYNIRRTTQAPTKYDTFDAMQLPTGSVLHTLNGLDTLIPPDDGLPDVNNPLLHNEKNPIWIRMITQTSDKTSTPFIVSENYTYRPNRILPAISHFYQTHRKFHRLLSDRNLGTNSSILTWIDYSPLNEIKTNGVLHQYRKFDIILRTMLNKIVSIGSHPHHYILIPQNNYVYSRTVLQRTFRELSTSTLNAFNHDPSIYFPIHVLGYIYGLNHELDVKTYKEDIGNESDIALKSTSLLERIDPSMFESINFIFQNENKAIVYNLGDIVKFSQDSSFYTKFYRHIMKLRLTSGILPSHIEEDSDHFDTFVSSVSHDLAESNNNHTDEKSKTIEDKETNNNVENKDGHTSNSIDLINHTTAPLHISPITTAPDPIITPTVHPTLFEDRLREGVSKHIDQIEQKDDKTFPKKDILLENHLGVMLHGKTLSEHINTVVPDLKNKDMDFVTSAPESSYQKSSLVSMDKAYNEYVYHPELAKVLSSTAKHGYFITKIDESHIDTEMDRTSTYKVSMVDLNNKHHSIKFTLPAVDKNGIMKLSGTEYTLIRQASNIPICKISPSRVNISSYYNKIIVERIKSKRFSYENIIYKLILDLKSQGLLEAVVGTAPDPTQPVAYDYSSIGINFTQITFNGYDFHFHGNHAGYDLVSSTAGKILDSLQTKYGAFVGTGPNNTLLFWDIANQIHCTTNKEIVRSWSSFNAMLVDVIGDEAQMVKSISEWTQVNILNQKIPMVFILAYQFGLKTLFNMINLDYTFYPLKSKIAYKVDDIYIRFNDGTLVFNRYPISRSLIASGLAWVSLKDFTFSEMSIPQTYVNVLALKGMSAGVLKGIRGFINFFVDPITEAVLEKLNDPITFHELLLKANLMLTDYFSKESSSVSLFRFRRYERFNGMVYNEIYRTLANHMNNTSTKKGFSINPEAVFQKIVQDSTMAINDVINPVHEIKQQSNFTYTGSGGRSSDSFVLKDRVYPKDGLGVISDSVPDSSKVSITSYLSASPNIDSVHGLAIPYKDGNVLEPPQILSIGAMVMPGGTTDDGKRNSYLSIQLSHYVPNHDDGETLSVRTGYDAVLPHLSTDIFASACEEDGVIESVDEKQKVVKLKTNESIYPTIRSLKLPYLDSYIDDVKQHSGIIEYLVPDKDINNFPIGGIFGCTKNNNLKVLDRLRCDSVEAIPNKDVAKKQNILVSDFVRGKYKSLYYIRFSVTGRYAPGKIVNYSFADIYSSNSGSYLLQKRKANVTAGEKVKRGDIIVYNNGFFVPDPLTKQVTFKHGVVANVALVEKGSNLEDACEISQSLSSRLMMTPCHKRDVITRNDAVILKIVKINDIVETTDPLCIISSDYLAQTHGTMNSENLDLMSKLNRQTPTADYTGSIRQIKILYGGDKSNLSDSLKVILDTYEKEVKRSFKALNNNVNLVSTDKPGYVKPGTKYNGIEFNIDTVILEFMIEETLGVSEGDKVVVGNANKSIVSHVSEEQHYSESGIPIDMLFSTTSIMNRIVKSPIANGIAERVMVALKEKAISMYFN